MHSPEPAASAKSTRTNAGAAMSDQACRNCGVPIIFMDGISQWWHMSIEANVTHTYRGCRDKAGKLTGRGCAEPEEEQ